MLPINYEKGTIMGQRVIGVQGVLDLEKKGLVVVRFCDIERIFEEYLNQIRKTEKIKKRLT